MDVTVRSPDGRLIGAADYGQGPVDRGAVVPWRARKQVEPEWLQQKAVAAGLRMAVFSNEHKSHARRVRDRGTIPRPLVTKSAQSLRSPVTKP